MEKGSIGELHHAHLLVGVREIAEAHLATLLLPLGFTLANNPDFFPFHEETFGIDEARKLRQLSARKAVAGRKVFFISSARLTLEAQNALLKTFEDPYADTLFFLMTAEVENILPTLRSRMRVVFLETADESLTRRSTTEESEAEKFLSMPLKKRLAFAGKFAEDGKNLQVFLNDVLRISRKKEVHTIALKAAGAPGASRLVLEHLALVL